jgi:arabinose-5-phosphate isomerase
LYHPGGALGKQLYLKVADIYPNNALPLVTEKTSIKETILEISKNRLGAAAVVDGANRLLGIVTDGDLRRMMENFDDISTLTAKDIMSKSPKTVNAEEFAIKALNIMQNNNIAQLIVTQEEKVVGFVHLHDLLKEGIV